MKILEGNQLIEANRWFDVVKEHAVKSLCKRARCGTVIVSLHGIETLYGAGHNLPAGKVGRCNNFDLKANFKSDKTCCVHAEQVAIMNALTLDNVEFLPFARLYFARVDDNGNLKVSGKPYCTICSKLALYAGIAEWCLMHESGVAVYDSVEYNELSYAYGDPELSGVHK